MLDMVILGLVQGLTEGANLLAATAAETNNSAATTDGTTTGDASAGEEVRTVLGEVLGLDATPAQEITIPEADEAGAAREELRSTTRSGPLS